MMHRKASSLNLFLVICLSSFIALTLTVIPLPQWVFYFRPDWMALVVVYWALTVPDRVGPWIGFAIGTVLEVLFVRNFGVLGFGMAILAFMVNRASLQLRVLSFWQQMLVVGIFVGIFKLVTGWLYGLIADFTITGEYWYSLLGSMLTWPFIFILLQELRRSARIN
jgi:rod shape-determining protein MreD